MAVFLINSCKFRGCDLVYETLPELIQHIEESHIGADGVVLECADEGSLTSLPCASLALQYFGNLTPRKSILSVKKVRPRSTSVMSSSASIRSLTPTSSEYDYNDEDEHTDTFNSSSMDCENNSNITPEQQFTSQLILRMMSNKTTDIQRPYVCPIQGCKKRYKNVNGVKYHARNGHKREAKLAQLTSKCFCGKSFRTAQLLQQHTESDHALQSYPLITHVDNTHEQDTDVKIEPSENHRNITNVHASSAPAGGNTNTSIVNTSKGVSVIHPLTLSGGVILTSSSNNRKNITNTSVSNSTIIGTASLVTSSTGELLLTRKLANGSLGTGTAVMTPPTTPHKTATTSSHVTSRSQQATLEQEQQQRIINEKVAKALAEAKEAMNALQGPRSTNNNSTTTQIVHLVNNINNNNKSRSMSIVNNTDGISTSNRVTQLIPVTAPLQTVKPKIEVERTSTASV